MNRDFVDKIICDNTLERLKSIPDDMFDMIFVDPPYWMRVDGVLNRVNGEVYDGCDDEWDNQFLSLQDYQEFTRKWLIECKRVLKKDGSLWVIGGMQCIYTIGSIMQELGFWFINDVVWFKRNPTPNFKGTRLNNAHETLIWATKDKKSKYKFNYKTAKELNKDTVYEDEFVKGIRKQMGSVWRISVCQGEERLKGEDGKKLHSTQKPEELLYRIIAINTNVGDLILDPFGGTMTTAAVAKRMGRHYYSIDREVKYCKFGEKRVNSIIPHIGDIENAVFDKKPPKVTFEEMINDNYFVIGEKLYYNDKPYFYLTKEGKMIRNGMEEPIDIHSGIAKIKNSKSARLNGWEYWQVERDGCLLCINEIRQKYLREVKNYE